MEYRLVLPRQASFRINQEMETFLFGIATNLASDLMQAGAHRLGDATLGDAQQRTLESVFRQALAAMLTEMAGAESVADDRELLALLEEQLACFFSDPEVADGFVE